MPIEPDERIGALLGPGERLVAVRRGVALERRSDWRDHGSGPCGDLYVTTRRLVHLGSVSIEYPLDEIREALVAAGALSLVVGEGRGVLIEIDDPRLLRVVIAAVREAVGSPEPSITREQIPHGATAASDGFALTTSEGQASSR